MDGARDELEVLSKRVDRLADELKQAQADIARLMAAQEPSGDIPQGKELPAPGPALQTATQMDASEDVSEPPQEESDAPWDAAWPAWATGTRLASLIGRTLIVLGGGYLVRALADMGVLPGLVGVTAGVFYALGFFALVAHRVGRDDKPGALFYGLNGAMLVYPLIYESTARFQHLGAISAAMLLAISACAGLIIAAHYGLRLMAWTHAVFALLTAIALSSATGATLTLFVSLIVIAIAGEVIAMRAPWRGVRWPIALVIDAIALRVGLEAATSEAKDQVGIIAVLLMCVPVVYIAGAWARALLRKQRVGAFCVGQTVAGLLVGLGGAARALLAAGQTPLVTATLAAAVGALSYAVAFRFVERGGGRSANFYYFSSLAVVLTLAGTFLLLPTMPLVVVWLALALASVVLGLRYDRITLRYHGAGYLLMAAMFAGLLHVAADGMLASPTRVWAEISLTGVGSAVVAALCYGMLAVRAPNTGGSVRELVPHTVAAALAGWAVACYLPRAFIPWVAGSMDANADLAAVATLRTGLLAALAVLLAWIGRRWSRRELLWLGYAMLVGGAGKLLFEDFRHGRSSTIFLSLALYGGALIVVSRLKANPQPS